MITYKVILSSGTKIRYFKGFLKVLRKIPMEM